jgi:hypothetical protein
MALGGTRAAFADAPGDRRLVVVPLRGALDGCMSRAALCRPRASAAPRSARLLLPSGGRRSGA